MQYKKMDGYCVICETESTFIAEDAWLRDYYLCPSCKSKPRERALINALNQLFPNWRELDIHESSPGGPSSAYIRKVMARSSNGSYTDSQFFSDIKFGDYKGDTRCENLQQMTFDDESFDLFITQDVFEHVLRPDLAFNEIARVLRKGGIHIFTMPWYPNQNTEFRIKTNAEGELVNIKPPVYHGNPISKGGSIVTVDWGIEFADYIYQYSKMTTMVYLQEIQHLGLEAEFLHVFISFKSDNTSKLHSILNMKESEIKDLESRLLAIENSRSFKMTKPLRDARRFLHRLTGL